MRSEFASILIAVERNESMHGGVQIAKRGLFGGLFHEWCNTLLDHQTQRCPSLGSGHTTVSGPPAKPLQVGAHLCSSWRAASQSVGSSGAVQYVSLAWIHD